MNDLLIVLLFLGFVLLLLKLFKVPECDHAEQIYYDAAGDGVGAGDAA